MEDLQIIKEEEVKENVNVEVIINVKEPEPEPEEKEFLDGIEDKKDKEE